MILHYGHDNHRFLRAKLGGEKPLGGRGVVQNHRFRRGKLGGEPGTAPPPAKEKPPTKQTANPEGPG